MHTLIKKTSFALLTIALLSSCNKKGSPNDNHEQEHHDHHHESTITLSALFKITLASKKIKNNSTAITSGEASLQETEKGHLYTLTAKENVLKGDTAIGIKITTEKGMQLSVKNKSGRPKTSFALLPTLSNNTEKELKTEEQNLSLGSDVQDAYIVIQKETNTNNNENGKMELIIVAKKQNNSEKEHVHLVINISS